MGALPQSAAAAALLVAMMLPSGATSAVQPGRIMVVVSRSSTTAGPARQVPGESPALEYTGVRTGSAPRSNTTSRAARLDTAGPTGPECSSGSTLGLSA